jgi:macrodomain Ter protein organizer (MatP/YcbG family)
METVLDNKRKLIDISQPVFETLSEEARRRQLSLKRLIESMLESAAEEIEREHPRPLAVNDRIRRLIGSAKPQGMDLAEIQDERLQYILSK